MIFSGESAGKLYRGHLTQSACEEEEQRHHFTTDPILPQTVGDGKVSVTFTARRVLITGSFTLSSKEKERERVYVFVFGSGERGPFSSQEGVG
jgi:hypothetical protein